MKSFGFLFAVSCGLLFTLTPSRVESKEKVILCYFSSWATYRWSNGKYDVEDIDPFLCSHIAYGFAGLDPSSFKIRSLDPYNDLEENWGKGVFNKFTSLKNINPSLTTLLSIGGWNEGASSYSKMASSPETRKIFIDSAIEMIKKHNFDGLDFDWEYPGGREDSPGSDEDRKNYIILLKELRQALDAAGNLKLTAAVSAGQTVIDTGYDVPSMAKYMDYINVMTYDYHGWWPHHDFTGHNSPLYALPEDDNVTSPGYHMNTNFSMNYYVEKGAPKEKLLMGFGAYGRGFILANPENNGFYSKATNGIDAGKYTATRGYWGYNEYCEKMQNEKPLWNMVRDPNVVSPYVYNHDKWFSFDDIESIKIKSQYILDNDFAGSFIWSIDSDDFRGLCGDGRYPLLSTLNDVLNGGPQTLPPGYTTTSRPTDQTTFMSTNTPPVYPGICNSSGLVPDPEDCGQYFMCLPNSDGTFTALPQKCDSELLFNPESLVCDWPENVPSCA